MKILCSVEILTRNNAETLERCLDSVKDFSEIIILDGNSTDTTLAIAQKYGCRVFKQFDTTEPNVRISNWSEVRNKGLHLSTQEWFMYIDSDEYLSKEAVDEIRSIISSPSPEAHVWWQPRVYVLGDKIIRCATTYPNKQIRLFHKNYVKEFVKPVHERILIKPEAKVGTLKSLEYVPVGTLAELRARWKRYIHIEEEMARSASRSRILRNCLKQGALLLVYAYRYSKGLVSCSRNARMPFLYEFTRHAASFILIMRMLRLLFVKK